jgi:hypothetical protein
MKIKLHHRISSEQKMRHLVVSHERDGGISDATASIKHLDPTIEKVGPLSMQIVSVLEEVPLVPVVKLVPEPHRLPLILFSVELGDRLGIFLQNQTNLKLRHFPPIPGSELVLMLTLPNRRLACAGKVEQDPRAGRRSGQCTDKQE